MDKVGGDKKPQKDGGGSEREVWGEERGEGGAGWGDICAIGFRGMEAGVVMVFCGSL